MGFVSDFSKVGSYLEKKSHITVSGHMGAVVRCCIRRLLSFEKAIEMGVDSLELDLNMTADGVIVVIHNTDA